MPPAMPYAAERAVAEMLRACLSLMLARLLLLALLMPRRCRHFGVTTHYHAVRAAMPPGFRPLLPPWRR